jgi:glycine oxidase
MPTAPDVLIAGGGPAGAAAARALALAGAAVTVVRPATLAGEAWRASAGMLAAQIETAPEDPLFKLGVAGRAFYRREAEPIQSRTGLDIGLELTGILQVALDEEDEDRFRAKVAWQRQQAQQAEWLEPGEITEQWPWLTAPRGAFWAPEDGTLDPRRLVAALLADAVAAGARVVDDRITGINRDGPRLQGATGTAGSYPAGQVVLAAGAWSGRVTNLPRPLSVEPVRGQMAAYPLPAGGAVTPVYGRHCYLLQREGELWAGSTMEHAGFTVATTSAALTEVTDRVAGIYPGIATATPLRTWAGLRPGTPDGRPIIGREPRLPGLWYATGYGRNGILLAGITGELVAQGIGGEAIPDELAAFRPGRFWSW